MGSMSIVGVEKFVKQQYDGTNIKASALILAALKGG